MPMNTIILVLDDRYNQIHIQIDPTTFRFYGHTQEYTDSNKDSWISFRPVGDQDVEQIYNDLKNILRLNVDKSEYIYLRTTFESYESDKRPRISVRLTSGYRGLTNPSQFWFTDHYERMKLTKW